LGLARFAAFNLPRLARTPHPVAFLRHTLVVRDPDLMSDLQRAALWALACDRRVEGCVVELGAWIGGTTVCLAAASHLVNGGLVYAVDTFAATDPDCEARVGPYGGSTWEAFQRNVQHAGVAPWVRVHRATTTEAARAWQAQRNGPIRLLFIDANHSYASVREDVENWVPYVAQGGIVAWHDHNEAHPGVMRAVAETVASDVVGNPATVPGLLWAYKR
jgi:hypothetical protein